MNVILWMVTLFAAIMFVAQIMFIAHLIREHHFRSSVTALRAPASPTVPQPTPQPSRKQDEGNIASDA